MDNFFSKIFKNKKYYFFLFPVFIALGIIIPAMANAGWVGCAGGAVLGGAVALFGIIFGFGAGGAISIPAGVAITAAACALGYGSEEALNAAFGDAGTQIFRAIVVAGAWLITLITKAAASVSVGWLQSVATSNFFAQPILTNPAYVIGWTQVRDLSNMFIAVGFIIVGIATTLRIESYGAKKILPLLIGVAILINFSNILCGVVIDTSNLLTNHFLLGGGSTVGTTIYGAVTTLYSTPANQGGIDWDQLIKNAKQDSGSSYVMTIVFFPVAYSLIAFVFFYLTFLLIARQAIFGIFFMISPLAFICWVFPATKKLWTKWWENFIKWAFISVQISFYLWIAGVMISGSNGSVPKLETVTLLSVIILLYVALRVAKSASAEGASSIIGLAGATLGMAWGATKLAATKGTAAVAGRAAESKYGQKMTAGVGRTMERMGLRTAGQTTMGQATTSKKEEDTLRNASHQQLADIANGKGMAGKLARPRQQAAAAKLLAERGKFEMVGEHITNPADKERFQTQAVERGKQFGYDASDTFYKADPTLAGHDEQLIDSIMKRPPTTPGAAPLTRPAAQALAVQEATQKLNHEQILKLSGKTLSNYDVVKHMTAGQISALEKGTAEQRAAAQTHLPAIKVAGNAAKKAKNKAEATRLGSLYKRMAAL